MKKTYKRPYKQNQIECVKRYCNNNNLIYTDLQIFDKYVTFVGYSKLPYEHLVNQLVREKYTDSEEFAILRKAVKEVTDEFLIYNAYVEQCKAKAKQFIAERERVINE